MCQQAAKRLATVDQCGRTLLHYCCTNHRTLVVDLLLERWRQTGSESKARHGGGLLERQDWQGLTALALAVIADNHVIVEHLLMMGADVCCLDNERHTVMHLATGNSQLQYYPTRQNEHTGLCHSIVRINKFLIPLQLASSHHTRNFAAEQFHFTV